MAMVMMILSSVLGARIPAKQHRHRIAPLAMKLEQRREVGVGEEDLPAPGSSAAGPNCGALPGVGRRNQDADVSKAEPADWASALPV